jgi:hypothetical protein
VSKRTDKSILSWIGVVSKYAVGVLAWLVVFVILKMQCVFNVDSYTDGLWQKELHDGLVENLIGNIAYRAEDGYGDFGCGDKYIYTVLYKSGKQGDEGKYKSLTSLVDVQSWKINSQQGIFTYFIDSKHKYTLRYISDGTDITAVDK